MRRNGAVPLAGYLASTWRRIDRRRVIRITAGEGAIL